MALPFKPINPDFLRTGTISPTGEIILDEPTAPVSEPAPTPEPDEPVVEPTLELSPDGGFDADAIANQLELLRQEALRIQESVSRLAEEGTPIDVEGISGDSEEIIQQEELIIEEVATLQIPDVNELTIQAASDRLIDILETQSEQLEARRLAETERLEKQFAEARVGAKEAQKREFATFGVVLQRLGGFLGPSISASGALINLAATHRAQLASLEAKKAAAIQAANNAITNKQFDIARLMAQEAKQVAIDINKSRQDFFDNSLKMLESNRQDIELQAKQAEIRRKANEPFIKVSREAGVLAVAEQVGNDPVQIFDIVNFTETGIQVGDITVEEIREMLEDVRAGLMIGLEDIVVKVNDVGQITGLDELTGKVLWTTEAGIARTGTATPNIILSPIADPVTGLFKWTQVLDKDTRQTTFLNAEGEVVDPSTVPIKDPEDAFDAFAREIIEVVSEGLIEGLREGLKPENE